MIVFSFLIADLLIALLFSLVHYFTSFMLFQVALLDLFALLIICGFSLPVFNELAILNLMIILLLVSI